MVNNIFISSVIGPIFGMNQICQNKFGKDSSFNNICGNLFRLLRIKNNYLDDVINFSILHSTNKSIKIYPDEVPLFYNKNRRPNFGSFGASFISFIYNLRPRLSSAIRDRDFTIRSAQLHYHLHVTIK